LPGSALPQLLQKLGASTRYPGNLSPNSVKEQYSRRMTVADLKGIRLAILASDGVEQSELTEPRKFLQQLGVQTTLLTPKGAEIQAMQHDEKGEKIPADGTVEGANTQDYDAVLLPGGALNADKLRMNEEASRFVREM